MLAQLIGKKVKIIMSECGKLVETHNLEVIECKDCLLKVIDAGGNAQMINTHSSVFVKLELQDGGTW